MWGRDSTVENQARSMPRSGMQHLSLHHAATDRAMVVVTNGYRVRLLPMNFGYVLKRRAHVEEVELPVTFACSARKEWHTTASGWRSLGRVLRSGRRKYLRHRPWQKLLRGVGFLAQCEILATQLTTNHCRWFAALVWVVLSGFGWSQPTPSIATEVSSDFLEARFFRTSLSCERLSPELSFLWLSFSMLEAFCWLFA